MMRQTASVLLLSLLTGTPAAAPQKAFRPGELWPDNNGVQINAHGGGMLVHGETFYWFGQHMVEGDAGNFAQVGVHVYSSKDLYNWKDEGIALRVSDDPKSDITKGCVLERPKVIYNRKTGKFVMWFHLELRGKGYGAARSGVAVADRPAGPYRFSESFRPNAGAWPINVPAELKKPLSAEEAAYVRKLHFGGGPFPNFPANLLFRRDFAGGQMARDMTLFVDDDGTAFHIYASEDNSTLQVSQLTADYLRPAGRYARVLPGDFNEAPAMFKYQGRYYLITSGCTSWAPNTARLAVADSIWGPWKALGNPCVGKDAGLTFHGQATYVLPLPGKPGAFIFMADRWQPNNAIDGRHLWLPIQFKDGRPFIEWMNEWDVSFFERAVLQQ
jgi:beta-xylosidase